VRTDIIVVGYNTPEFEANTLSAIIAHTSYGTYQITYAQNARDNSLASFWNELIATSTCEQICLLNPDTVPAMNWLGEMHAVLRRDPNIGAVVPSSNLVHVSQVLVPFPRMEQDWSKINTFARTLVLEGSLDCLTLSAMCVLFRKSTWHEAGGFDTDFPLYGEDSEFFWRVRTKLNKRLVWCRSTYCHHYGQQCTTKAAADGEFDYVEMRKRAMELFIRKTGYSYQTHGALEQLERA